MFDTSSLLIFMAATLALLIVPGPAVLYIIARSVRQGPKAGFISTLGIGTGSFVHIIFAALGLSAVLVQSALAFSFVKYLGAGYLIYLGVRTIISKAKVTDLHTTPEMSDLQIFRQGFIVNLLNPKTALFFFSFLPQFVNPSRGQTVLQILILGGILVGMGIISDGLYALIAGSASQFLSGNLKAARIQKYMSGTIFISLGIMTALTSSDHRS